VIGKSRTHAGRGSRLEKLVAASIVNLEAFGLALYQSTPPFKPLKFLPNGQVQGYFISHGQLDFYGDLDGRFVTFDTKSCQLKTRVPLDSLHEHQVAIVRGAHRRKAIAFFLVEMVRADGGPRYFALTWDVLGPYWRCNELAPLRDRKGKPETASIPFDVLASSCLEIRERGFFLDMLDAVKRLNERF
jgi:recombination protein U